MKKFTLFLFLLFISASPVCGAEVAAPKIDLSAVARKLPRPLWQLVLEYFGKTTDLHYLIKEPQKSAQDYFLDCLWTNKQESDLYFRFYLSPHNGHFDTREKYNVTIIIQIPFTIDCCKHTVLRETYPLQTNRTNKPVIISKDKRFKAEQKFFDPTQGSVEFFLTDHRGIDPLYPFLYQQLVTNQPSILIQNKKCIIQ